MNLHLAGGWRLVHNIRSAHKENPMRKNVDNGTQSLSATIAAWNLPAVRLLISAAIAAAILSGFYTAPTAAGDKKETNRGLSSQEAARRTLEERDPSHSRKSGEGQKDFNSIGLKNDPTKLGKGPPIGRGTAARKSGEGQKDFKSGILNSESILSGGSSRGSGPAPSGAPTAAPAAAPGPVLR